MKNVIKLSVVLVIMLFLGGVQSCKTTKNESKQVNSASIEGTWILKSLNGQAVGELFKGEIPTMTVDLATKRISGSGGCNTYTGPFSFENGIFTAANVAATMKMCVVENKESQFFATLAKANTVSVEDGILVLKNGGKVAAEFVKGIDQNLLSGTWTLESIEGEDMKALFTLEDKIPTIKFNEENGRISGNAGCNSYGAPYSIEGSDVTVGVLMSTRMACPNMSGESIYTKAVAGTSTLNVSANTLTFSKEGKVILRFKK